MWVMFYILSVAGANIITAAFQPVHIVGFIIPTGTFFIGLTLLLRNMVQIHQGRKRVYFAIVIGLILSGILSHLLNDPLTITVASAISFAISESMDTEVFTQLRRYNIYWRILSGGAVGGILDSTVFVVLGLSPLGVGFLTWVQVPMAILGQMGVKLLMQALGGIGVARIVSHKQVDTPV